jgi:hypothetical protein
MDNLTIRSKSQTDPVGNEVVTFTNPDFCRTGLAQRKELARRAMRLEIKNGCVIVDSLEGYSSTGWPPEGAIGGLFRNIDVAWVLSIGTILYYSRDHFVIAAC